MSDRIEGESAIDLEKRFLTCLRFERIIGLNAPRVLGGFLKASSCPVAKLSERCCAQCKGASFEAFDCGDSTSFGDSFDDLEDRGDDFRAALCAGPSRKLS